MLNIKINLTQFDMNIGNNGILKEVNGLNGAPISIAPGFPDLQDQFNQMGIKHIRLHDVFGIGDLDNYFSTNRKNQNQLIPNIPSNLQEKGKEFIAKFANARTIYPNSALGMRKNNIDLAFKDANYQITDYYIKNIMGNDANLNPEGIQRELIFRIGRTLDGGSELPENIDIYASLISTLVDRYSAHYYKTNLPRKVKYWEIWNEPDLTFFWNSNDPEKYYEFYEKVAKMIKSVDPETKVGGAGVANGYNPGGAYLDGLLKYCRDKNVPIDFISWHYYGNITSDPQNIIDIGDSINNTLKYYGFSNIESLCTEWNSSPFGTVNNFTKVQSAKNAAYIASSLIYMQHCKVDKAYYYRGDGSSFGLFNDNPNPKNKNYKSFCTYSAQAFYLFSKMFSTSRLLENKNNFSTGISILAGRKDNKINILISNYKVDKNLTDGEAPPDNGIFYKQYYLDSNRSVGELTDSYSIEHWFGGKNPKDLYNNNEVIQRNTVSQLPVNGNLKSRRRDYSLSQNGVELEISGLDHALSSVKAYRIKEEGDLSKFLPEEVTNEINITDSGTNLTIQDQNAKEYTVTLICIELNDNSPIPAPIPVSNGFTYSYTVLRPQGYELRGFGPDAENFRIDVGDIISINVKSSELEIKLNLHDFKDKLKIISSEKQSPFNKTVVIKFLVSGKFNDVMRGIFRLIYTPKRDPISNTTILTISRINS